MLYFIIHYYYYYYYYNHYIIIHKMLHFIDYFNEAIPVIGLVL